jgi:hypothetical protein
MASYSTSFTAVGLGPDFSIRKGDSFSYSVTGTFVATWVVQINTGGGWSNVTTESTSTGSGTVTAEQNARFRIACVAFTSGTAVTVCKELVSAKARLLKISAASGKAGTTAGWVPAAGNNLSLATCPASQSASTLVIPISGLCVGDKITGFYGTGQVESAGGTATLDIALRKHTAAAADVADAAVASITQLSVTADAIISASNARANDFEEVVAADESFYFLVTATTAALTDFALQSITLELS